MSEAREKLKAIVHDKLHYQRHEASEIADAILASGFVLPEKPKDITPYEREFLDIAQVLLAEAGTSYSRRAAEALAKWHLEKLYAEYVQGVRDRCECVGGKCQQEGCPHRRANDARSCGTIQREAKKRYGQ